jgi:hypothetical protein
VRHLDGSGLITCWGGGQSTAPAQLENDIMKKIVSLIVVGVFAVGTAFAGSLESKYDADAHAASAVVFGPAKNGGQTVVKFVSAVSTGAAATVKFYARSGSKAAPTALATNGAVVVSVANTGNIYTTNDLVAYVFADGVVHYTTVAGNNATTVTLAAGLPQAGSEGDFLYELSLQGQRNLGAAAIDVAGDAVFVTPSDSPLRVLNDGTGGNSLTVTVQK